MVMETERCHRELYALGPRVLCHAVFWLNMNMRDHQEKKVHSVPLATHREAERLVTRETRGGPALMGQRYSHPAQTLHLPRSPMGLPVTQMPSPKYQKYWE